MTRFSITVNRDRSEAVIRTVETRQGLVSKSIFMGNQDPKVIQLRQLQAA